MKLLITLCILATGALAAVAPLERTRPQVLPAPFRRQHDTSSHVSDMAPEMREYMHDIMAFVRLFPRQEIRRITREHIKTGHLPQTTRFMRSAEFGQIMETIASSAEAQELVQYFQKADWPWMQKLVAHLARDFHLTGNGPAVAKRHSATAHEPITGLTEFIEDIIAVLPAEELRALYQQKTENAESVFARVMAILTNPRVPELLKSIFTAPELKAAFATLKEEGIDMEYLVKVAPAFIGMH